MARRTNHHAPETGPGHTKPPSPPEHAHHTPPPTEPTDEGATKSAAGPESRDGGGGGVKSTAGPDNDSGTDTAAGPAREDSAQSTAGPENKDGTDTAAGPRGRDGDGTKPTAGPDDDSGTGTTAAPAHEDSAQPATGPENKDGTAAGPAGKAGTKSAAGPAAGSGTQAAVSPEDEGGTESVTGVESGGSARVAAAADHTGGSSDAVAPRTGAETRAEAAPSVDGPEAAGPDASAEAAVASVGRAPVVDPARDAGGAGDGPAGASEADAVDQRVAAVRRVSEAGRRWRVAQLAGCAALLAVALTAGSIAFGAVRDGGDAVGVSAPAAVSPELMTGGDLDASITALQTHLRSQPRDFGGWATLGLAYVEQARTKGDPSRYPQAERALKRSLDLAPDNVQALTGRAALAAARHDFTHALDYADQVLKLNPYSERALSSRIDALVELGRYDDALRAADLADERRPGIPVFTRYAYVHELRGDVTTARRVLEQGLASATTPGDVAYVATALGQLAWNQGEYDQALTHYARALAADDTYLPALEGRARTQAASGDRAAAIKGMEAVVARYPLPGPLVELGELYEDRGAEGDRAKADDQYALVDAWTALARAGGVNVDLDTALAAADHGDKAEALRAARAEWARRHTVHTADALAWALHVNGRDEEALPYARRATATGYRNASFRYHRGVIEHATGHEKESRAHLKAALELNAGFSPLGARAARTVLEAAK